MAKAKSLFNLLNLFILFFLSSSATEAVAKLHCPLKSPFLPLLPCCSSPNLSKLDLSQQTGQHQLALKAGSKIIDFSGQASFAAASTSHEFDELMGKSTPFWSYLQAADEVKEYNLYKAIYQKNLSSSSRDCLIPKVVHFIWLGPRPFPPTSVENVRSWIAYHPDWTFKFWTDRDRPPPCNGMEVKQVGDFKFTKLERCFSESENYGEKSDILRYEILWCEGGIYVDHDVNCLQSFDSFLSYDLCCGLEPPHPPFVGKNLTFGNAVLAARPHHTVLAKTIDIVASQWDALAEKFPGRDHFSRNEIVMQRTYMAFTLGVRNGIDQEGNCDLVCPAAYFFAKGKMNPIYAKHFFANTWAEETSGNRDFEKSIRKMLSQVKERGRKRDFILKTILGIDTVVLLGVIFFVMRKRKVRIYRE